MTLLSETKIARLVATRGKVRVYEMEDRTWLTAADGTVSWRNNNPGNLKFGYEGSSDATVHSKRTKEKALRSAQAKYKGVVDLDQWGNAVFESYDAGREAQKSLLLSEGMREKTVEELVKRYSADDYSGQTHHASQAATIHATAAAQGFNLHGVKVGDMTEDEVGALADGVSKAENWTPGRVRHHAQPLSHEDLQAVLRTAAAKPHASQTSKSTQATQATRTTQANDRRHAAHAHRVGDRGPEVGRLQAHLAELGFQGADGQALKADRHFGPRTREAVEAFQDAHGLKVDGVAGKATLAAIAEVRTTRLEAARAPAPSMLDADHPANGMYEQAFRCVARIDEGQGRPPGEHTRALSAGLTNAALAAGMKRIDHVVLSDDASRGYAVEGSLHSPFKQYAEVDVMQAIRTPLSQSSAQALAQRRPDEPAQARDFQLQPTVHPSMIQQTAADLQRATRAP